MTDRIRAAASHGAARVVVAGAIAAGAAIAMAAGASADPEPEPVPGQPVVETVEVPADIGALPPVGQAPVVPEIQQPQNQSVLSYLGDLWEAGRTGNPESLAPGPDEYYVGAPPGAGPAPQLPPGYISLTAPESTNLAPVEAGPQPALPDGYYSLDGPPPPGYYEGDPAAPVGEEPVVEDPVVEEPVPATP